jgi:UDP-N-acetyl-D-mannosaminuronate dehydrogenase
MDCIIIAAPHDSFKMMGIIEVSAMMGSNPVLIDVKGIYSDESCPKNMIHKKL